MKRHLLFPILLATLLSMPTLTLSAQQEAAPRPAKPGLQGIWQLCTLKDVDGQVEMHLMPYLKILSGDGTFTNVLIRVTEGGSKTTESGTYTIDNDTIYTEAIAQSTDSAMLGYRHPVTYHLQDPRWLITEYKKPGNDELFHEIWMRIVPQRSRHMEGHGGFGQMGKRPMQPRGQMQHRRMQGTNSRTQSNPFQSQSNTNTIPDVMSDD